MLPIAENRFPKRVLENPDINVASGS